MYPCHSTINYAPGLIKFTISVGSFLVIKTIYLVCLKIPLHYKCYISNLIKIGSVVLEKKMLTDDGRRTPTHSNRSLEWLRWPKKGTLKFHDIQSFSLWTNFDESLRQRYELGARCGTIKIPSGWKTVSSKDNFKSCSPLQPRWSPWKNKHVN